MLDVLFIGLIIVLTIVFAGIGLLGLPRWTSMFGYSEFYEFGQLSRAMHARMLYVDRTRIRYLLCPNCHGPIQSDEGRCPHCRTSLT